MSLRIAFAIAVGLLSAPAAGQQDIEGIIKRLQSVPATSTKSDCDKEIAKAVRSNAFDLFYGSGVCTVAKQKPEASFLLLAGQIRATPDMGSMMPATQADAKAAVALYGFIYSYAGGMGDEAVLRDKAALARLNRLLDKWKPILGAGYNPGWATRRRPDSADYLAAIAESAAARRKQVDEIARLYADDIYYALHRQEDELYARQGGPVDANGPVAKQLGELARKMNERAIAIGAADSANQVPADEAMSQPSTMDVPPDSPGSDERVIDGASDSVAKHCADGAEFSAILQNARVARVVVTTTAKWGTVWRADLEGGQTGPERHVCTAHYDGSRPLDGPGEPLAPLSFPSPEAKP